MHNLYPKIIIQQKRNYYKINEELSILKCKYDDANINIEKWIEIQSYIYIDIFHILHQVLSPYSHVFPYSGLNEDNYNSLYEVIYSSLTKISSNKDWCEFTSHQTIFNIKNSLHSFLDVLAESHIHQEDISTESIYTLIKSSIKNSFINYIK